MIRTGRGSFVILDEKQFPRPYINLSIKNAIKIHIEEPEGFDNLKKAFNENILENAGIRTDKIQRCI